jgi:outer membrane lipoprotein-sorting protein
MKREKKISNYIDQLNKEKKPKEHIKTEINSDQEELLSSIRMVKSLKEPTYPDEGFPKKLAKSLENKSLEKGLFHKQKKYRQRPIWIATTLIAAAVLSLIIVLNDIIPLGNTSIVYAMEKAFENVKVYHGIIEVVEINENGEETLQAKREVWADTDGRYYLKELEGTAQGIITINNGTKKWQIRPDENSVYLFPAFPDAYQFSFELDNEIEIVRDALAVKEMNEEQIVGRMATKLKITPKGGESYYLWIDKETNLPLRRQTALVNAIGYTVTYTEFEILSSIPEEYMSYNFSDEYNVIESNPEQVVSNMEEAEDLLGFTPNIFFGMPNGFNLQSISILTDSKILKLYYKTNDNKIVVTTQKVATNDLKPDTTAMIGAVNGNVAEILTSLESDSGLLTGAGTYEGVTGIGSIRWQDNGIEYSVYGNVDLDQLKLFVHKLSDAEVIIPNETDENKPEVDVPVDLIIEENEQKSVDAGHSPWKLDPAFVAQVFASLALSPQGIQGDYPIKYDDITMVSNNGVEAVAEIAGDVSTIRRVYLKRLVRQDETGIWSVIGYDSVEK